MIVRRLLVVYVFDLNNWKQTKFQREGFQRKARSEV